MSSYFNIFNRQAEDSQEEPQPEEAHQIVTRSRAAANNLQLPTSALSVPLRGVGRGRRSPSPAAPGQANTFNFPATETAFHQTDAEGTMATPDTTLEELRAAAAAAVSAANAATAALNAATGVIAAQPKKKPELPQFDTRNIEVWIRRVEAAFDRVSIVSARDKFVHLESKFSVGANPKIDEFLYGAATDENWKSFLTYLRTEYGRTRRQEAQYLRGAFSRDGRRPSQMLAQIKEKSKMVSIDDVRKEIIVSSLPPDVQHSIVDRIKDMDAEQTASLADHYFDQEGKPLNNNTAPSILSVDHELDSEEEQDPAEVNAIGSKFGRKPHRKPFNSFKKAPTTFNGRTDKKSLPTDNRPAPKTITLCQYHTSYGDNARSCQVGCSRYAEWQEKRQGNFRAGNRK